MATTFYNTVAPSIYYSHAVRNNATFVGSVLIKRLWLLYRAFFYKFNSNWFSTWCAYKKVFYIMLIEGVTVEETTVLFDMKCRKYMLTSHRYYELGLKMYRGLESNLSFSFLVHENLIKSIILVMRISIKPSNTKHTTRCWPYRFIILVPRFR